MKSTNSSQASYDESSKTLYNKDCNRCCNGVCDGVGNHVCSRCKAVKYCSRECQLVHWNANHRDECSLLSRHKTATANTNNIVKKA